MRLYEFDHDATPVDATPYEREPVRPEETLESWIHANPGWLLDEPLLLIGRQVRLDTGVADLVGCDEYGNVVVIEVKIGQSGSGSASEETIIGQPQSYASALSTYTYDDLNAVYEGYQRRLADGKWSPLERSIAPGETLREAFAETFGSELDESEFNTNRRMVIVAEEITDKTARHVRDLNRQGLSMTCVEIGWFRSGDADDSFVVRNIVVDHDRQAVKPDTLGPPTYPELVEEIVTGAFDDLGPVVGADHPLEVFPGGFDKRTPRLTSAQSDHPDSLEYRLAVQPDTGKVTVGIDNPTGDEDARDQLLTGTSAFREAGFTVNEDASQWSLVKARWSAESVADVEDLGDEIAQRFVTLVRIGHDVFCDEQANS